MSAHTVVNASIPQALMQLSQNEGAQPDLSSSEGVPNESVGNLCKALPSEKSRMPALFDLVETRSVKKGVALEFFVYIFRKRY